MSNRRPRFDSQISRTRNSALRLVSHRLRWLSPSARFFLAFGILVLITTELLAGGYYRDLANNYRVGDIVKSTVIAPADISGFVDNTETERQRAEAMASVRPVFNFDVTIGESVVEGFRKAWVDLQKQSEARVSSKTAPQWSGAGGPAVARAIIAHHFDANALDELVELLRASEDAYIYEDSAADLRKHEIALIDPRKSAEPAVVPMPLNYMTELSVVQRTLQSRLSQLAGWSPEERASLASAMLPLIRPTVIYNAAATEAARQVTAERIPPATVSLKRNQVVAREGEVVSERMPAQFAAIRAYGQTARPWHRFFGLLLIVSALFWSAWKFIEHRSIAVHLALSQRRAFGLIASAVVIETILMRVGFTIADSIATRSDRAPFDDPTIWNFGIPFAAAALLVGMLVDTELALIAALITALFAALLAPNGALMAVYAVISCSAGIYGIGRYRERQSVTLAGLLVGAANAVMALALITYAQQSLTIVTIMLALGCGVAGGLLTIIFTAGGLPINESLFGILTDVKLLELSNADLPVLGQLALRAPGTNQHSHALGQLAEDACRAVGANPLLARIGALYHDIGKLAAPEYFVENQQGNNPHDRLRPTQSARIITSHVTYGLKLAKQIGLPKLISDFIPQHHGTRTLHFFLRKAQAHAAEGEQVNEAEFRYPGPKPQFKEAAIMMIADSCEAAARSLARPDPESIRAIVGKIVDAIINDGQLDECEITLRELTTIRESTITALTAIYHARIDYPGFNPPPLTAALPSLPPGHLDTEERGISYSKPSEIPINKAGEVEDEALPRRK
jgi:putative nucleotidyltransferase with HDIG domain